MNLISGGTLLYDLIDPIPGDLVIAKNSMRAWETDDVRGKRGSYIDEGNQALVLETWVVGNQRRLRVLFNNRVLVFVCRDMITYKNWDIVKSQSMTPSSDRV